MLLRLPVAIIGIVSCSPHSQDRVVELRFDVAADAGTNRTLSRNLQLYVHDVQLLDSQGRAHPLALVPEPPWQSGRVALLDLAGASGPQRTVVRATLPPVAPASYSGMRFTVGVPFELNHANPLTAAAPLDRGELFWTWQAGYKFMRADLAVDGREWSFHLGSAGCVSAAAVRPPTAQCAQPNRWLVQLRGDPLRAVARFDPAPLAEAARANSYTICTGDYSRAEACARAYASTGLQSESGACVDGACLAQKLWTLK